MMNKLEIRAFALEQVVKMRCMSEYPAKDLVSEAKILEDYIIGNAELPEHADELKPLREMFGEMREIYDSLNRRNNVHGCGVKDDDELGVKYAN